MLSLPTDGLARSVHKHNSNLQAVCDWLEANALFVSPSTSLNDVVDALCDANIYRDQDFANEFMESVWVELRRRALFLGQGAPFVVDGSRLNRTTDWKQVPDYSFCLALAIQPRYSQWSHSFGADRTEQGELFERLAEECLRHLGWTVLRCGWNTGTTTPLASLVESIGSHIGEAIEPGAVDEWMPSHAKDYGVDIVCSRPFQDRSGGRPLYFVQCASGDDWSSKLHTPDIETWWRVIRFSTRPRRGFAMPFALSDLDFRKSIGRIDGIFLDRFRLCCALRVTAGRWLSKSLENALIKWTTPRVKALPLDNQ